MYCYGLNPIELLRNNYLDNACLNRLQEKIKKVVKDVVTIMSTKNFLIAYPKFYASKDL